MSFQRTKQDFFTCHPGYKNCVRIVPGVERKGAPCVFGEITCGRERRAKPRKNLVKVAAGILGLFLFNADLLRIRFDANSIFTWSLSVSALTEKPGCVSSEKPNKPEQLVGDGGFTSAMMTKTEPSVRRAITSSHLQQHSWKRSWSGNTAVF